MEFSEAVRLAREAPADSGIGTLGEKLTHAALKLWLEPDRTRHEVLLPDGSVADIFDGRQVTEIQTAGFSAFRPKLERLLAQYPVTVVHPLVRQKQLVWIDPATGEAGAPHRSPRRGSFTDAGGELIYLLPCLFHPQLTVRLLLLDVEEHRLADGRRSRDGKRGSHRLERYPLALADSLTLTAPADYAALIPPTLPQEFTAAAFGKAARLQGRRLNGTLKLLRAAGCLDRDESVRPYRWQRTENMTNRI